MTQAEAERIAAHVLELGREGRGRAEIAAALELSLGRLRTLEDEQPAIALALRRAATEAQGWWEALQREALMAGARPAAGAWREAMAWRFGAPGRAGTAPEPPRVRVRYEIPDNGKEPRRRGPDAGW